MAAPFREDQKPTTFGFMRTTLVADVVVVRANEMDDHRGWFAETFKASAFATAGIPPSFPQENQSYSRRAGTLRGLHYQRDPAAQGKLVRCLVGSVFDVAVDIRKGSPTYGRWVAEELSAENRKMMWVPPGFAHGIQTLEDDTEILYKVTREYSPEHERAIRWDDPEIGVEWPNADPILSEKDVNAPFLADADNNFTWDGDA